MPQSPKQKESSSQLARGSQFVTWRKVTVALTSPGTGGRSWKGVVSITPIRHFLVGDLSDSLRGEGRFCTPTGPLTLHKAMVLLQRRCDVRKESLRHLRAGVLISVSVRNWSEIYSELTITSYVHSYCTEYRLSAWCTPYSVRNLRIDHILYLELEVLAVFTFILWCR